MSRLNKEEQEEYEEGIRKKRESAEEGEKRGDVKSRDVKTGGISWNEEEEGVRRKGEKR